MTRAEKMQATLLALTMQNVTIKEAERKPALRLISDKMTLPGGVEIEQVMPVSDRIFEIPNFTETDASAISPATADAFVGIVFSQRLGLPEWIWKSYVPIIRSDTYTWAKNTVYKVFPRTVELPGADGVYPVKILNSTVTVPAEDYGAGKGAVDAGWACTFTYPGLPVGLFSVYSAHNNSNDYIFLHLRVYPESLFSPGGIFRVPEMGEEFQYSHINITFSPNTGTRFSFSRIYWNVLWPNYDPVEWSSLKYYNGRKISMTELFTV